MKVSDDSKKWQAESDASTMATYQEIINDKQRMQRAIKVAKDRAKDLNKRANAMQSVASFSNGGKMTKASSVSRNATTSKSAGKGRRK
jgi:hypothetical protein